MKKLIGLAPCLLVSFVLLSSAELCYVESQRAEMTATQSARAMEAVRSAQMLATQGSVEAERVRNEVDSNFDVLADFSTRTDHQVRIIRDSQSAMPDRSAETDRALNSYARGLRGREERIERFKSGFAIVRNSRRFVPIIGEQLAETARDEGYGRVEAAARQVLDVVQNFLGQPTRDWLHRMEQATHMLAENADSTPLRTQAETLNKHVHALARHHRLTERRFEEAMRTDLEDRATRAIDLLDTDYRRSETNRRYFDYGFWMALGLAVFYWGTLGVRWMNRRRKGHAATRAPEAILAAGAPSPWGMGVALATAGGPGFPLEGAHGPGRMDGEVRLKAEEEVSRPGRRNTQVLSPEPLPEDAREKKAAVEEARVEQDRSSPVYGAGRGATAPTVAARRDTSISPGVRKDPGEARMANVRNSLHKVMGIDGAIGAALMDVNDGLTLATAGGGETLDIEATSAGNLDVVRAEINVLEQLGLDDGIEDILITLGGQHHLFRPLERNSVGLFLYVALDRERGNLGMARHQLKGIEADRFGVPAA